MTVTTFIILGIGFVLGMVYFGYQEYKKKPKKIEEPFSSGMSANSTRPDEATSVPKQLRQPAVKPNVTANS